MKTVQGVFRNGKIETLEDVTIDNNTKLLIVVTDERISDDVAPNLQGVTVIEKIRRRTKAEVTSEQQVNSREKLKQIAAGIEGKLPFQNVDDAIKSLRRYGDDTD